MAIPEDVRIFKSAPDSPTISLGFDWSDGESPLSDFFEHVDLTLGSRRACEQMIEELEFIARGPDGEDIALWTYRPGIELERAPIVTLDSEGRLECPAATLADYLLTRVGDPGEIRAWCAAHGIDTAPSEKMIHAKVRLLPSPQDRWDDLERGMEERPEIRLDAPTAIEHLLGMAGADPRALRFLESVEAKDCPLEIQCDGWGRVKTVFLSPDALRTPVSVRGVSLGAGPTSLEPLGRPHKSGQGWFRWDEGDLALHVELSEARVSRITLMLRESLPPHLH
jgi:hypothetical protein